MKLRVIVSHIRIYTYMVLGDAWQSHCYLKGQNSFVFKIKGRAPANFFLFSNVH